MNLRPEEISSVIKEQIKKYAADMDVSDTDYELLSNEELEALYLTKEE